MDAAMKAGGFWTGLDTATHSRLAESGRPRRFRRGQTLCREGDRSRAVLLLRSGHVRILSSTSDGREVIVGVRGEGDVVGELAAIDALPRSATVEALDDVDALEISGSTFVHLCRTQPRLSWALVLVLSARLRDVGKQRLELGSGTALRRVAAQLMQLAVQHGLRNGDEVEIAVPATQAELAMTAAMSRESWARATRELRQAGVISTGRRQLTIHRLAELRRLAS
ncbi:Crp/Fnr family transcriptional regulator [Amycolatopsis sp. NPDC024027]|uniref:Crp/Fnr family transcriptional regulator n=1 Tax=Amycolatopsis sp. NPDC024027 TaxID=3154327 RepID=UPI0033DCB421